jgi:hypothetical protein
MSRRASIEGETGSISSGTELAAGDRRDLARHAGQAQAVGAVGGQLDREQGVVQAEVGADVGAHRRVLGQRVEAGVVLGETELARRAQHAEGLDAAQLGLLDLELAGQHRADHRARHLHAGGGIGRAADDLQQLAGTGVDLAELELVGVGVLLRLDDLRHHDATEGGRGGFGLLDLEAGHGQQMAESGAVQLRIDEGPQPLF